MKFSICCRITHTVTVTAKFHHTVTAKFHPKNKKQQAEESNGQAKDPQVNSIGTNARLILLENISTPT